MIWHSLLFCGLCVFQRDLYMHTRGCDMLTDPWSLHNVGVKTWHLNTYYISSRNVSQISTQVIAALVKHFFLFHTFSTPMQKEKATEIQVYIQVISCYVCWIVQSYLSELINNHELTYSPAPTDSQSHELFMCSKCQLSSRPSVRGQGDDLPHTALNTLTHTYIQREREFSHPSWGGRVFPTHTHHTHKTVYASVWFLLYHTWSWN